MVAVCAESVLRGRAGRWSVWVSVSGRLVAEEFQQSYLIEAAVEKEAG